MAAAGLIPSPEGLMVLGELELSGKLRPVRGVLAASAAGLKAGLRGFIVPAENAREAAILASGRFAAVSSLREAAHALSILDATGRLPARDASLGDSGFQFPLRTDPNEIGDFSEVQGQKMYKRALEIAAAGGHHLLAFGPPGSGKTMLARRMATILAPLSEEEAVETTRLHSLAGSFGTESDLVTRPPFRSPHHSASAEGILGGGRSVHPGEISLAHNGVLFLDEAPEFKTNVLQALREPLEDSWVTISRADGSVRLPADFQLILAANPCPCGRLGIRLSVPDVREAGGKPFSADAYSGSAACFCSGDEINRHWRRLGSALLDRIELRIPVLPPLDLAIPSAQEDSSAEIAGRVRSAVGIQRKRFDGTGVRRNSRMPAGQVQKFCAPEGAAASVLRAAADFLGLSGRACHGVLRVARTIADLEGSDGLKVRHVEEAIQYRRYGEDPYDILSASGMPSI